MSREAIKRTRTNKEKQKNKEKKKEKTSFLLALFPENLGKHCKNPFSRESGKKLNCCLSPKVRSPPIEESKRIRTK